MKRLISVIVLAVMVGCAPSYPSLGQIDRYDSPDQETLYGMLETLQRTLNERDVDGWFALYADDAIITYTKNLPTPKQAVMDDVRQQDLSTWNFTITDIKIVSTAIDTETAKIETILRMKTGNTTRNHPETYYFAKTDGTWLITKETNP
jgi:hypothetical protein